MEARNSTVVAKKLWNVLRITFFMIRKGLISKRKMVMDMNLAMKKGRLLRKSLSNLIHYHHHHSSKSVTRVAATQGYYEFSCSNSPNPVFLHMPKRNKHHFMTFPCINAPEVLEDEPQFSSEIEELVEGGCRGGDERDKAVVLVPKTPEYTFNFGPLLSPFSVRVSNYSALDENEEIGNVLVDDQAEDFIRRFYEQLRTQSLIPRLVID